jgi:zinc protease
MVLKSTCCSVIRQPHFVLLTLGLIALLARPQNCHADDGVSTAAKPDSSTADTSTSTDTEPTTNQKTETADTAPMKITEIEGISEYRFENGVRVLLFPDDSKDVVTVNMTVLVGSRHEGYGEAGMAHLLEHMLFKGTPLHPNVPKELQDRGANFNGTTWLDRTNYYETLPATDENLEFAIRLEADRMINSFIRGEDLASEMTVVRNEFERGENSPIGVLMQRIQAVAYEWHNYGKSTIGNRSDIERVPIVALRRFYKKYYRPDNSIVIVAGKFDPEKALTYLETYFGGLETPDTPLEPTYTIEPAQDGERTVVLRRVGDVQYAGAAYHIPASSHPDFAAVKALVYVLADEPSGRLYKQLVETELASNVFSMASPLHDPGVLLNFVELPQSASIEKARTTMLEVIENSWDKEPVTEEEVERAKQQILKARELESSDSSRIAVSLSDWAAQGDWRLYFLYRDTIEALTAEQVQAVAKKYFVRNNRTVGLFIPTEKAERVSVPEAPNLATLLKDYKGRAQVAAGEAFDIDPIAIEKRTERGELFSGYQYALLPKKTRGESVTLMMTLRFGDEKSLKGRVGAAELVGALMQRGTDSKTYQQLQDALTKLRAELSMNSTVGLLQLRVKTKREFVPEVIDLIVEILKKPKLDSTELEVLRRQVLTGIEGSLTEPQALVPLAVTRTLSPYAKDDVRYVPTMQEELEIYRAVTIDQIRDLHREFIGASVGEVSAVGDFDSEAVKKQLTELLSTWKSKQSYARIDRPAVTNIAGGIERINTPDKSNAMLFSSQQFALDDEAPEYAALDVGTFILGGGTLSSRLGDRVRQQEGLSYGIRSSVSARHRDLRTDFTLYAITNPANVDRLMNVINEELDKIRKDGITEDELAKAKEAYLQNEKVRRADDGSLASQLLGSMFNRRTLQFTADYEKRIADLTVPQVNDALKKYVLPKNLVTAVGGDFEKKE